MSTDLAPIEGAELAGRPVALAVVFPTDDDAAEVWAALIDATPELAHASDYERGAAIAAALDKHRDRMVKAKARRARLAASDAAPVFPTDQHVAELRAAIPAITDRDIGRVLDAGPECFAASVERQTLVLDVTPDDPEAKP